MAGWRVIINLQLTLILPPVESYNTEEGVHLKVQCIVKPCYLITIFLQKILIVTFKNAFWHCIKIINELYKLTFMPAFSLRQTALLE